MSFKRMIRRTCARVARNFTRGPVRSSAPEPLPTTPDEWAADLLRLIAETIDDADADALALADSAPVTSSDATPAHAPATAITDATSATAITDAAPATAITDAAPASAPAPAVIDAENTDEAAAQRVPDEALTTGNLRQRAQQYNVARQLAAERSKSEGLVLLCIQLEDELAIERTRASVLRTAAKTQPGGHDPAQMRADIAEAAPSSSRHSSKRSSTCTIVGDFDRDEIARMDKELAIATAATTVANERAARAERAFALIDALAAARAADAADAAANAARALEQANARADRAERALEAAADRAVQAEEELVRVKVRAASAAAHANIDLNHANKRAQRYEKECSAESASNRELRQRLIEKDETMAACLKTVATTSRMLGETQNELAAERHAASERAKVNKRRGVDAGQQTDDISCRQQVSRWCEICSKDQLNIDHLAEAHELIKSKHEVNKELHEWNDSLQAQNTGLELYLEIMTEKFEAEQELKKSVIRQVRDWVKKTECQCFAKYRREDLLWELDKLDK
ncbi:hypothetical protein H4R19_005685 [Coemansia spiralis]|nr:hypothetical protein H4R19_005685 [Coemansia spiralis]